MSVKHPLEAYQVNAFADQAAAGSPTGVVLHADALAPDTMLAIARSLDVSHTAFLSESSRADCRFAIRFFTPHGELKNCAHATIAAHYLWKEKFGLTSVQPTRQETSTGVQEVWTTESDESVVVAFRQNPIALRNVSDETVQRLTEALGCASSDLHPYYQVRLLSPGSFRFMVPFQSAADVLALDPDYAEIDRLSREMDSIGCFAFSLSRVDSAMETIEAHARMFAPTIGVREDAVNGNSSGCLGAYLLDLPGGGSWGSRLRLQVRQGHHLGHAASVNVEANRVGDHIETRVGGSARLVGPRAVTPAGDMR